MVQRWIPASFRGQVVIVAVAAVAVTALGVVLIRDAVTRTEQTLLEEARLQCMAAARELATQYQERTAYGAEPLSTLPFEARDLSLRGIASTVLRAYEGVEGGYFDPGGEVVGYAFPTSAVALSDPSAAQVERVRQVAGRAGGETGALFETGALDGGLAVIVAQRIEGAAPLVWAMKRVAAVGGGDRRVWWLVGLVAFALLGVSAIVWIWLSLRGGIELVKDGLLRLENDFAHRLPARRGDFGEISAAINQMAERRLALEEELRHRDRLAALGRVVAGVAHEIRNPLNSIRLTLELLHRRIESGRASPEEAAAAVREIDRLDAILGRLLAFGQPGQSQRQKQDVRPVLDRAAKMVKEQCREKGVAIVVEPPREDASEFEFDAAPVEQVLINLLLNALDACPRGGEVRVAGQAVNGQFILSVSDNGGGIPAEARPYVFDAFFTTKANGSGLGLSVSREIAMHHGGDLEFDTTEAGTVFRLRLPLRGETN